MATFGVVLTLTTCWLVAEPAPTLTSQWGTVEGVVKTSPEGKKYQAFYGIPYAKPPVGNLRFKKPQPNPGPTGTFRAKKYGPACPQPGHVRQNEDCLTLNVFRPEVISGQLPVMVWIHGGGFEAGSAVTYEPWKIVTEGNVIVVTIQYRLGVLGFLSTGSSQLPGNYALWDMTLALQWVKDNIDGYDGNTNDVTIFGESAGSKAVSYLLLSEKPKQLFQKAIMQSGSATSYFSFRADPRPVAVALAIRIKCNNSETSNYNPADQELFECLSNTPVGTLMHNSDPNLGLAYFSADFSWSPVVDHEFLVDSPLRLLHNVSYLERVDFYDKDLMVGVNNEEGGYMLGQVSRYGNMYHVKATNTLKTQTFYKTKLIPLILHRLCGSFKNSSVDLIANYYFPGPMTNTQLLNPNIVIETQSDASIVSPSVDVARAHARHSNRGKTYFYLFDHYPSFLAHRPGLKGIVHAGDLLYSFGMTPEYIKSHYHTEADPAELQLSKTFVAMYTDFAKSSDPNQAVGSYLSRDWPQFDHPDGYYLSFSTNMSIKSHVYRGRVSLWLDDLPMSDPGCRVDHSPTSGALIG